MELKGALFEYKTNQIAYSNNVKSDTTIILVGGLEFNILSLPYTSILDKFCKKYKINLTIPQFRSHPNFGIYSIDDDIEDLRSIVEIVKGNIILIGNSTGCQVILLFLKTYLYSNIRISFLQGPVSDVEYEMEKRDNFLIPGDYFVYGNTVYWKERFVSLYEKYNKEDLFSSYLSDKHFKLLNEKENKLVFLISEKDEYAVNPIYDKLQLVSNSETYIIKDGDHFLSTKESQKEFIRILKSELFKVELLKRWK